jgi:hypothetical protein
MELKRGSSLFSKPLLASLYISTLVANNKASKTQMPELH